MRARLWMGLVALLPFTAAASDPLLDKTLACMRANIPQTVRIQTVEVTAWDRGKGTRSLKGKLYGTRENNRVRVNLRIDAPADLAGASYLVREGEKSDEMHLYLPSVKKTRRITGASLDGQLWGTDLSYSDLKQLQNAFTGANVKREPAPGKYQDRATHVLTFEPRPEDGSRYKSVRTQIDQQTCVALLVEMLDGTGVRKTLTTKAKDLKQADGKWYASEVEIKDVKNGTQTRLQVTGVSTGDKLAARYFHPQTFYLGN
ncbi:MAG TPA: outer membrane lipoprotein-sorting protein [Verrucomicrobiae bacterium]|nr:outer membrane lipoprotein-sorting protein [Verrucomicrobiae bacterium]